MLTVKHTNDKTDEVRFVVTDNANNREVCGAVSHTIIELISFIQKSYHTHTKLSSMQRCPRCLWSMDMDPVRFTGRNDLPRQISPKDPLPIFRPNRYLLPTLSSIARRSSNTPKTWCKSEAAAVAVTTSVSAAAAHAMDVVRAVSSGRTTMTGRLYVNARRLWRSSLSSRSSAEISDHSGHVDC